jgi:thiamine-phosphate pyrophosphorylase
MECKKEKIDYSLYFVTDRKLLGTRSLQDCVLQAVQGGCTLVQLREKDLSSKEFLSVALGLKRICKVPLIINDRIDIALAMDADGVHVGQNDIPTLFARKLIGNNKLLGVSVCTKRQAIQAEKEGADYLGVGAMHATGTKQDADLVSLEELIAIKNAVTIPIVAIGGMHLHSIPDCAKVGIAGVAVVSAILAEQDIVSATKKLKEAFLLHRENFQDMNRLGVNTNSTNNNF